MENNKKILIKFTLYFLTLLLIIIIGISNAFALTNDNSIYFYDNLGSSLSSVSTSYIQQTDESNAIFTTTANSYGGAVIIQLSTPLIQNHIYSLFINVGAYSQGGYTELSTKNCIGLGTTFASASSSYVNCSITPRYSQKSGITTDKGRGLYYTFIANSTAPYLVVPYTTQFTCTNCQQYSFGYDITDGGDTSGLTQSQVNTLINNQTTLIQQEISNLQSSFYDTGQDIIDNQNDNTQDIIDNNNDNTDRIIEDNKKNFQSCRDSYNILHLDYSKGYSTTISGVTYTVNDDYSITINGTATSNSFFNLNINNKNSILLARKYYLSLGVHVTGLSFVLRDNVANSLIYLSGSDNTSWVSTYTGDAFTYIRVANGTTINELIVYPMLTEGHSITEYEEYGKEICSNKLDEQTNAINGLNDNINDDNTDGATSEASEFFSDFNTNTFGLTSIITAPLNLIQSLTSKTCTPLHLPLPYLNNKYLDLPCMSTIYSQHFGTFFTLYQTITYGIIAYWVCVRIFNHVKDFKNPEHDEIEVVDL